MAGTDRNMEVRSCSGHDPHLVARVLADRGMLKRAKTVPVVERVQGGPEGLRRDGQHPFGAGL